MLFKNPFAFVYLREISPGGRIVGVVSIFKNEIKNIKSKIYGTYEDFKKDNIKLEKPIVIKPAEGSMSMGVSLNSTLKGAKKTIKNISNTKSFFKDLKDLFSNYQNSHIYILYQRITYFKY